MENMPGKKPDKKKFFKPKPKPKVYYIEEHIDTNLGKFYYIALGEQTKEQIHNRKMGKKEHIKHVSFTDREAYLTRIKDLQEIGFIVGTKSDKTLKDKPKIVTTTTSSPNIELK
jgi:hypothetical protein